MTARLRTLARLARWPFRSRYSSPLWVAVRLYLGFVWLQFGVGKIQTGWLTRNPLGSLLDAVAAGHTPAPFPFYRPVARLLVETGMDSVLTVAIPLTEVTVGLAFVAGVLLVPAAVTAILLNVNLVLAGIASIHFDGRIIALQLLLLVAWRVAGFVGLGTAARWIRRGRPRPPLPA